MSASERLRCLLAGHKWRACPKCRNATCPYACSRCGQVSAQCGNCGRYHDPRNIVVCVVNR